MGTAWCFYAALNQWIFSKGTYSFIWTPNHIEKSKFYHQKNTPLSPSAAYRIQIQVNQTQRVVVGGKHTQTTRVVRRQHSLPEGKFLKSRSKSKVTRLKVIVSNNRFGHKDSTCEISNPNHIPFKKYSQG